MTNWNTRVKASGLQNITYDEPGVTYDEIGVSYDGIYFQSEYDVRGEIVSPWAVKQEVNSQYKTRIKP